MKTINSFLMKDKIIFSTLLILFNIIGMSAPGLIAPTGLIGQKELVLIWDEGNEPATTSINHQVAKLITGYQGQPDLNQRFEFGEKVVENDGSYGNRQLDVTGGDFNGDGLSEYVAAFPGLKITRSG